ncbi:MAG: FecR domain-containing protein [Bacteroidota bacterium]
MAYPEIDIIIHKQIIGEISPEEARVLRDWINNSPDNQLYFDEIEKGWHAFVDPAIDFHPNVKKGLAQLNQRIDAAAAETPVQLRPLKPVRVPIRSIIIRLAAVVVLCFGLLYTFQQLTGSASGDASYQTGDQIQTIELEDGSIVTLNAHSKLEVEAFDSESRTLQLFGEAYFDVASDPDRPFIIHTDQSKIQVLGTAFNVRAFDHEIFTEVQVEHGKVAVIVEGQRVDLEKMDKATYHHDERLLKTAYDESLNALAWKTGALDFEDTPLQEAFQVLERHYNIRVLVDGADISNCRVFSDFQSDSLKVVLETLKTIFKFDYEISGQLVKISGKDGICQK